MEIRIPVHRVTIEEEELEAVRGVLASGWLGMGSLVERFEQEVAERLGVRHVVAVSNGTAALYLALSELGITEGDEVILPSFTHISTAQAVLATGAKPVFCEVREEDLLMDPTDAASRVTERTRAIVPVHYGGRVCDLAEIRRLADSGQIRIVEDAAQAFGSWSGSWAAGCFGDAGCLSFDTIKAVTCGGGGAVVTNSDGLARRVRERRNLGITSEAWHRIETDQPWRYEVRGRGLRSAMPNLNACIGLAQLPKMERFRRRRLEIVRRYDEALSGLPGIEMIRHDVDGVMPFNYVVRVKDGRRQGLARFLRARGIGSWVHFIPCHMQPLFAGDRTELPVTEQLYEEVLSLPFYSHMTDGEVQEVTDAVRQFALGANR